MTCPKCNTEMELVTGEIYPATQEGGDIKDAEWGEWHKCPECNYEAD